MNIPIETKPALWGFVGGAVAMAIVGFSWGGWVTGGKSEAAAVMRADAAVVAALAPVCVAKFKRAPEAEANLVALKKIDSWSQGEFIDKGGWATTIADAKPADQQSSVAKACAVLLTDKA